MDDFVERRELITAEPAVALARLLDVPSPDLAGGQPLPLCWHWLYLLDRVRQADLGPDGHPVRGTLATAPATGQRRMWVGGEIISHRGLICSQPASRRSRVVASAEKSGRSGKLTFVTVEHLITQCGALAIEEHQQLVYRDAADLKIPSSDTVREFDIPVDDDEWSIDVTPVLLFRFSALTYNAHRIHYDRDYARNVEGYPGLLTHGPLQALIMAEAARACDRDGGVSKSRRLYTYRLSAPLFDFQGLIARAEALPDAVSMYVRDRHGRETARGLVR